MRLKDKHPVTGTGITIGRRINTRTNAQGQRIEQVSKNFTAEYRDETGVRRIESLGTPNKREAIRRAQDIYRQLTDGIEPERRPSKLAIKSLRERYLADAQAKSLAPTTVAKYKAALDKFIVFCDSEQVRLVSQLNEELFNRFGAWMRSTQHKQCQTYASKTIDTDMTIIKAALNWAVKNRLIRENPIREAKIPKGRSKPQPCFTESQVQGLLIRCWERMQTDPSWRLTRDAIVLLAYSGMRVGELRDLLWVDVILDRGEHGVFHIRRGGSNETTKDRDERFVPIAQKARIVIDALPRGESDKLLPGLRERTLLARVKRLCRELHYPHTLKVHSFRHFAASRMANSNVPYRMALEFLGHSSSELLDVYYHLEDDQAQRAMAVIADDNISLVPSTHQQRER